jgi:chemotaxis protein histidine kinase CheA
MHDEIDELCDNINLRAEDQPSTQLFEAKRRENLTPGPLKSAPREQAHSKKSRCASSKMLRYTAGSLISGVAVLLIYFAFSYTQLYLKRRIESMDSREGYNPENVLVAAIIISCAIILKWLYAMR